MAMNVDRAGSRYPEQDLINLEHFLGTVFRPVKPRNEFVQGLQGRLMSESNLREETGESFRSIFFILIGIMGGIIVVAASIKATLSLVEAHKLLRQKN